MGVWKKLNSQDAFVTSYVAKKQWAASPSDLEGLGVRFLPADNTYKETNCDFKLVNCSFRLEANVRRCEFKLTAQGSYNCYFSLGATLFNEPPEADCTFNLNALSQHYTPTPTPTATPVVPTPTPTPTYTVDCTFELDGNTNYYTATPTPTSTATPTVTNSPGVTPTPTSTVTNSPAGTPTPTPTATTQTVNTLFQHIPNI